jgi:hypothetical protein
VISMRCRPRRSSKYALICTGCGDRVSCHPGTGWFFITHHLGPVHRTYVHMTGGNTRLLIRLRCLGRIGCGRVARGRLLSSALIARSSYRTAIEMSVARTCGSITSAAFANASAARARQCCERSCRLMGIPIALHRLRNATLRAPSVFLPTAVCFFPEQSVKVRFRTDIVTADRRRRLYDLATPSKLMKCGGRLSLTTAASAPPQAAGAASAHSQPCRGDTLKLANWSTVPRSDQIPSR